MTGDGFDDRPARTTATLAAVVAAVVAGMVGVTAGFGRTVPFAMLGSALLAAGAWGLDEESRTRQAAGSVAATAGAALLFGVFVLSMDGPGGWVVFALFLGVAFVAVDAAVGFGRDRDHTLSATMRENASLLLIGVVVTAVVHLALFYGVAPSLFGGILGLSTVTPLVGFVSLQVFALAVALLVPRAVSVLERWLPDDATEREAVLDSVGTVGLRLSDVPRIYWGVLAAQFVLTLLPGANALFGLFFGGALAPVFTSGVLHALFGLIALTLLAVLALAVVQRWTVVWLGAVPARTLALEAGGIASIVAAVLLGLLFELLPDTLILDLLEPVVVDRFSPALVRTVVGVPSVVLGLLLAALLAVVVLVNVGLPPSHLGLVPRRATGFALGSAFIFLATLGAVPHGVPGVVAFAGVAGALLTWDLGSHATDVGRQLGQVADTRRSEFVHVTGSSLVLAGATVVATLGYYVVVPALAPANTRSTSGLAVLSLVLVLVAVLAFVTAAHLRGRTTEA